jgi:hypothetical protein
MAFQPADRQFLGNLSATIIAVGVALVALAFLAGRLSA